jgi:hypothetical protein
LLGLALASCSRSPTAPIAPPDGVYQDPEFVQLASPMGRPAPGLETAGASVMTVAIDGAKGGYVVLGRFGLCVPAGAWVGVSEVTLKVADPTKLQVDLVLEPAPASLTLPLELGVDCTGARGISDSTRLELVRNNGRNDIWYRVSSATMKDCGWEIRGPVSQPARYGVLDGRAGW